MGKHKTLKGTKKILFEGTDHNDRFTYDENINGLILICKVASAKVADSAQSRLVKELKRMSDLYEPIQRFLDEDTEKAQIL